jgi:hypothetical protein
MPEEKIQLTPEQETLIWEAFSKDLSNPPSITELVKLAFPTLQDADGRGKEGRAIKSLLAVRGVKARTTNEYQPVPRIELPENHKEFIRNNRDKMTPVDLARTIFNVPDLNNSSVEARSVAEYMRTLPAIQNLSSTLADVPEDDYRPPKSVAGVLQKVDKYIFHHPIKKDEMTAAHKNALEALLAYMNTFRFVHQINLYESQTNRDLFESSFVRYCYDKADLTEEEVDQYIVLSHEAVNSSSIQTRIERLQALMEESTGNDNDRARISMSLVEAINTLQTEYNQCVNRTNTLLNSLKQKRSDRLAELRAGNASILNLIQVWKEEKSRHKLIHIADLRKAVLEKAAEELSTVEDVKARIMGHNPTELIHG